MSNPRDSRPPTAISSQLDALRAAFEEAEAERLRTKVGTADRAAATAMAARRAGDVAWAIYELTGANEARPWLVRQGTLARESASLWAPILDEGLQRVSTQVRKVGSSKDAALWQALWLESIEVALTAARARGVRIDLAHPAEVARGLRAVDHPTRLMILRYVSNAATSNLVAAQQHAGDLGDTDRQVRAATDAVAWARTWVDANRELSGPGDALTSSAQLADALDTLARLERTRGSFDTARRHFEEALAVRRAIPLEHPHGGTFETLEGLAGMHLDQGALEDARATFERALEDVERHAATAATDPQPDAVAYRAQRTSRASLLQGLAAVLERQGHHAASLRRYREAEQETARVRDVVAREATRDETLAQFESRVALAVLFSRVTTLLMQARLGEGEGAEAELREIFQSLIKTRADPTAVIALGMRIAALDASRGDWERAVEPLAFAQRHFRAARDIEGTISSGVQLATTLYAAGRPAEALPHAEEALQLARGAGLRRWTGRAATALARMRLSQGNGEGLPDLLSAIHSTKETLTPQEYAAALVVEGRWHEAQGHVARAVALYGQAVDRIEHLRAEPTSQDGFYDVEAHYEPYERLVRVHIQRGDVARAFRYLQLTRRKELRQAQPAQTLRSARPEVHKLLVEAGSLQARMRVMSSALSQERARPAPDPKTLAATEHALSAAVERWRTVGVNIARLEPAYSPFVSSPPVTLAAVQGALPPRTALIVYAAPLDQNLDIFVITRERVRVRRSPIAPADVWKLVAKSQSFMDESEKAVKEERLLPQDSTGIFVDLHQALLAPVLPDVAGVERLVIVPTRSLHYLPFGALARRTSTGLRFLLQDREVVYLSGAALDVLHGRRRPAASSRIALTALGNPTGDLDGADGEADAIGALFPMAVVLKKDAATPRALRKATAQSTILHFAAHGVLVGTTPGASHLRLAPDETSDLGHFTVSDIRALDASGVDMVTLSACVTSRAQRHPRGLAVSSLSDAFLTAGVSTVVGTLWSVEDKSTQMLMTEFYRHFRAGRCKGSALRAAQLSVMRTEDLSHPYYWSGFLLFGDWGRTGSRIPCSSAVPGARED